MTRIFPVPDGGNANVFEVKVRVTVPLFTGKGLLTNASNTDEPSTTPLPLTSCHMISDPIPVWSFPLPRAVRVNPVKTTVSPLLLVALNSSSETLTAFG